MLAGHAQHQDRTCTTLEAFGVRVVTQHYTIITTATTIQPKRKTILREFAYKLVGPTVFNGGSAT